MASLEIHQIPCLQDNYGYLIHDPDGNDGAGATAAIDTPDSDAIFQALDEKGWRLTHILNTHHHGDHAGGNLALKEKTGCRIIGPKDEAGKIPGIDDAVGEGDEVTIGTHTARVFDVPGHTAGHIAYYFGAAGVAFVGDALFALGCGRLFEGTPDQMWTSLQKLKALPDDTKVYCAHEYTQANAKFALTVDPSNEALVKRASAIDRLRSADVPTVPSTIGLEKETNPFLRPGDGAIREALGLVDADDVSVFAEIRRRKDNF